VKNNNKKHKVDQFAKEIAISKFALPVSVHIPIAAKSETDVCTYIGEVVDIVAPGSPNKALLVEPYYRPSYDTLPIWQLPESAVLHYSKQLGVHVNYNNYRRAYLKSIGRLKDPRYVLDHVMNRRVARLKFFSYLRIVPISRAANSSSGGLCEKMAVEYHSSSKMVEVNKRSPVRIQYADIADIVKMLNLKTGGSFQEPVNNAQALVQYPDRTV